MEFGTRRNIITAEMPCLYCGKALSVVSAMMDGDFCNRAHRAKYHQRLLNTLQTFGAPEAAQAPPLPAEVPGAGAEIPQAAEQARPAAKAATIAPVLQYATPSVSAVTAMALFRSNWAMAAPAAPKPVLPVLTLPASRGKFQTNKTVPLPGGAALPGGRPKMSIDAAKRPLPLLEKPDLPQRRARAGRPPGDLVPIVPAPVSVPPIEAMRAYWSMTTSEAAAPEVLR